ncbi:MAG: transposase [Nitrosopumilus sp.]|nr:transposase [Nitrosopumilus sp.]
MLFDPGFLQNWRAELKKMNEGKEGPHYRYPNSLISGLLATVVHAYLLPYRQLEGFLRMMSVHIKRLKEEAVPDFTTIRWRVAKMQINLDPKVNIEKEKDVKGETQPSLSHKKHSAKRWVVERTNSWHNRFRKLFIRYEKKVENYLGLVQFYCCLIIYRKIILG